MAAVAPNEIDDAIKNIKESPGYQAYILMNNDGIVIKYENVDYQKAVGYAYHVLNLYHKSKRTAQALMETDNEVECIRLHTSMNEIIIAQYAKFTIVVLQHMNGENEAVAVEEETEHKTEEAATDNP